MVAFSMMCTSVQDNVVNHIALVFGVVETERAAQVFRDVLGYVVVVTGLHMHGEGIPETDSEGEKRFIKSLGGFIQRLSLWYQYSWILLGMYVTHSHCPSFLC